MAKDLLDLTAESAPDLTDQLYLVTDSGTVDKRVTTALLLAIRDDHGLIYDPLSAMTLSATPQSLIAATAVNTSAVGFTADETTGVFTFNTDGAGVLYKLEFNFVIPKGTLDGEEVYAQVNYESAITILAVTYVGTESVYASVSGSTIFTANNSGDEVSIEVGATATSTSQTPVEVNITLSKI